MTFVLPLLLSTLAGCPETPEDAVSGMQAAPPPNAAPTTPGEGGEGMGGDAAAGGGIPAAPSAGLAEPGSPPAPANTVIPGFASMITDGKSITISGTLKGAKKAQIDFVTVSDQGGVMSPLVVEIAQTTDGTFSVKAPASMSKPMYVIVNVDKAGDGPSPGDAIAFTEVSKIEGKDITLSIDATGTTGIESKLPWAGQAPPAPTMEAGGAAVPPSTGGPGAPKDPPIATDGKAAPGGAPGDKAPVPPGDVPAAPPKP
ncbi:hypothetical protein LBMAG42_01120 [Deltaproteobacteria bacterium]|nr:hypothetical protein LBMAG42_01120 [Deltaproteobacteria bacterium]